MGDWSTPRRRRVRQTPGPSREVRRIAEAHVCDLETRITEMQAMAKTLKKLVGHCRGDDRPECPILDDLALGPPNIENG